MLKRKTKFLKNREGVITALFTKRVIKNIQIFLLSGILISSCSLPGSTPSTEPDFKIKNMQENEPGVSYKGDWTPLNHSTGIDDVPSGFVKRFTSMTENTVMTFKLVSTYDNTLTNPGVMTIDAFTGLNEANFNFKTNTDSYTVNNVPLHKVSLYALRGPDQGKMRVYLDGVLKDTIDLYSDNANPPKYYASTSISNILPGVHTLTLRPAYEKNAASSGYKINIDEVILNNSDSVCESGMNEEAYLVAYPDVRRAIIANTVQSAYQHYLANMNNPTYSLSNSAYVNAVARVENGFKEEIYLKAFSDVSNWVKSATNRDNIGLPIDGSAYVHYNNHGINECGDAGTGCGIGRIARSAYKNELVGFNNVTKSRFHELAYLEAYSDVRNHTYNIGITAVLRSGFHHMNPWGFNEGRLTNPTYTNRKTFNGTVTYSFTGSSVNYRAKKNSRQGLGYIFIDGALQDGDMNSSVDSDGDGNPTNDLVDLYSASEQDNVSVFSKTLSSGNHTIDILPALKLSPNHPNYNNSTPNYTLGGYGVNIANIEVFQ